MNLNGGSTGSVRQMASSSASGPDSSGPAPIDLAAYSRMLELNNSLKRLGATSGRKALDLPCIFVVGDESVGKSSLLEQISGVKLPRGKDIVTRCPILLSMCQTDGAPSYKVDWEVTPGVWAGESGDSPEHVADWISTATEVVCGEGKTIVNRLITVTVRHKTAPNLTLMDLPGLKANHDNTESAQVCEDVHKLVKQRLEEKQAIILLVLDSRVQMTNQGEAWKLVKDIDKEENKTLVVFTKADARMDGERIRDLIAKAVQRNPVKLNGESAYHAVRLPATSPDDSEAEDDDPPPLLERKFFKAEADKAKMPYPCATGVPAVTHHLTKHLKAQLIKFVPELKQQVRELDDSIKEKIAQQKNAGALDELYLEQLRHAVVEAGATVGKLCHGHTLSTDPVDRQIHPKWDKLGEEFRKTILGEGDMELPFWFFSDDCRSKITVRIGAQKGKDPKGLEEHPDHVRVAFLENVCSRLEPKKGERAETSPIEHMLQEMHTAVETAISSILTDSWQIEDIGPKFYLPQEAQDRIMQKIREIILKKYRDDAQIFLSNWRCAQKSTVCTFNPRYIIVSKHLVAEFTKMYTEMDPDSAQKQGKKKEEKPIPPSLENMLQLPNDKAAEGPTVGRAAREVITRTLLTVLSMLLPVPDLGAPMDRLLEALYQAMKRLALHIAELRNDKRSAKETGEILNLDTEEAKSKLQLTLAALSMIIMEGWYQQVPTAIEHFMISQVGKAMEKDLFHRLGMDAWAREDLLELMRPSTPQESMEMLEAKAAQMKQFNVEIEKLAIELLASQAIENTLRQSEE